MKTNHSTCPDCKTSYGYIKGFCVECEATALIEGNNKERNLLKQEIINEVIKEIKKINDA